MPESSFRWELQDCAKIGRGVVLGARRLPQ